MTRYCPKWRPLIFLYVDLTSWTAVVEVEGGPLLRTTEEHQLTWVWHLALGLLWHSVPVARAPGDI